MSGHRMERSRQDRITFESLARHEACKPRRAMSIYHVRSVAILACSFFGCRSAAVSRVATAAPGAQVFLEAVLVDVPSDTPAPVPSTLADAHRIGAARGRSSSVNVLFGGVPNSPAQRPDRRLPPVASHALACERYDLVPQRVSGDQIAMEWTFHGSRPEETTRDTVILTGGQLSAVRVEGASPGRRRTLYVRTTFLKGLGDLRDMNARAHQEAGGGPPIQMASVALNSPTLLVDPACGERAGGTATQTPD